MSAIDIRGIAHRFGDLQALAGVDLRIAQGEFFSLLGPSGCGKTTLLNIIAGFLSPSAGSVVMGERDITGLPPHQRDIGMVFQNYALFPHLNVFDNVAYGLRVRKENRSAIRTRVTQMLELVQLPELAQRMPHQLSGGQQQRVAIARALAIRPQVLLLDEPLSNLDAKLRKQMQTELRRLLSNVGVTTVMVTHDQDEALGLSDRIGILGGGRLQQVGTPLDLYRRPVNRFVGEFVGQANLIETRAAANGIFFATRHFSAPGVPLQLQSALAGKQDALFLLRPERIRLSPMAATAATLETRLPPAPNSVNGEVREASYTGAGLHLTIALAGGGEMLVEAAEANFVDIPPAGTKVHLSWDAEDLSNLPGGAVDGLA